MKFILLRHEVCNDISFGILEPIAQRAILGKSNLEGLSTIKTANNLNVIIDTSVVKISLKVFSRAICFRFQDIGKIAV